MQPIRIRMGLFSRFIRCAMLTAVTPTMVEMAVVISVGMKKNVRRLRSAHLRAVHHDADGYQYQPGRVHYQKHNHRVGSGIFFRIQLLKLFHGFQSHRGGGIVQPQHVGGKVHEDGTHGGGVLGGISGKRRQNTGLSQRESAFIIPLFSPIFMMPSHKDRMPVSPSDISNAVLDESNVGVDKFRKYFRISHKQEFAECYNEGDYEKCYPDVI